MMNQHAHQVHIFDVDTLRDPSHVRNFAIERLYFKLTVRNPDEIPPSQRVMDKFDDVTRAFFLKKCGDYLSSASRRDALEVRSGEMSAADLERFGKQHLAERVRSFFVDYYMEEFQKYNLFGLIEIGIGSRDLQRMEATLLVHLQRLKRLVGELIVQEESLYEGGPEGLDQTLYLGIHTQDGTTDGRILQDALRRLGPLTRRNLSPRIEALDDPHRLQLSYGLHGISLSSVPSFYRTSQSMMGDYLQHQAAWMGPGATMHDASRRPWTTYPQDDGGWATYGRNEMPAHSSGETEQMALDPASLNYTGPCSSFGPSLLGRVIREVQDPVQHLRQQGDSQRRGAPANGAGGQAIPGTSYRAGASPQQPIPDPYSYGGTPPSLNYPFPAQPDANAGQGPMSGPGGPLFPPSPDDDPRYGSGQSRR